MSYRLIFSIFILVLVIVSNSLSIGEEDRPDSSVSISSDIAYGAKTDFVSKYLWRGISYNKGLIAQPSIWVSTSDFTLEVWGSYTFYDVNDSPKRNEIDLILSYQYLVDDLSIAPSFTYYTYPNQEDSPPTGELGLNLSYQIKDFTLFNYFTYDIIKYSDAYFNETGILAEKELHENLSVSSSVSVGYASGKFNETYIEVPAGTEALSKSTFSLVKFDLAVTYSPFKNFNVSPHFQFNRMLDNSLIKLLGRDNNSFGVNIEMEF